jgi:hypothetical protein
MKQIEFKDVAHLYLGCKVVYNDREYYLEGFHKYGLDYSGRWIYIMNDADDATTVGIKDIKPLLRPLSSMTDKELRQIEKLLPSDDSIDDDDAVEMLKSTGVLAKKLLEMNFDLFGLIENNQAIDATKTEHVNQ